MFSAAINHLSMYRVVAGNHQATKGERSVRRDRGAAIALT